MAILVDTIVDVLRGSVLFTVWANADVHLWNVDSA